MKIGIFAFHTQQNYAGVSVACNVALEVVARAYIGLVGEDGCFAAERNDTCK